MPIKFRYCRHQRTHSVNTHVPYFSAQQFTVRFQNFRHYEALAFALVKFFIVHSPKIVTDLVREGDGALVKVGVHKVVQ